MNCFSGISGTEDTTSVCLSNVGKVPNIPRAVTSITTPSMYLFPWSSRFSQTKQKNSSIKFLWFGNFKVLMNNVKDSLLNWLLTISEEPIRWTEELEAHALGDQAVYTSRNVPPVSHISQSHVSNNSLENMCFFVTQNTPTNSPAKVAY